jgi:LuxR family transcriptional regulator, maltose regulon positive regulatory protein
MVKYTHKIVVPQRPTHLLSRPRLNELLESIGDRQLLTIVAPVGYGKTSLLIDFAHQTTMPVCWYTLDATDQDSWTFYEYIAGAIEQRFPGTMQQVFNNLALGHGQTHFSTAIAALTHDIYTLPDFVVVLDDWHLVDQVPEIITLVSHLLLHCPRCHLILASRIYPSLPNMMLLTSRRQMGSLDDQQLRFTADEAGTVVQAETNVPMNAEQIAELVSRANGWITGILLAVQPATFGSLAASMLGFETERQVYRFLVEQVFDQQPPNIRAFLLDSALLEEFCADVCDAIFEEYNTRQYIEILLRRHLFLTTVRPGVFRYQPLFREFLREHYRTVSDARYRAMMLRVAKHYVTRNEWTIAFEYYLAIGSAREACDVIRASGEQLFMMGRFSTLEHWFSRMPQQDLDASMLCLKARVLLERGSHQEAQALVQQAELRMLPEERLTVYLVQALIMRISGRYAVAIDLAQQVLDATEHPSQRTAALRTLAISHHRTGATDQAIAEFKQAVEIERGLGNQHQIAQLHRDLSICYKDLGMLDQAELYCSYADAHWKTVGNVGLRTLSLNSKGCLQHQLGNYCAAHDTLLQALQCGREAVVPDYEMIVLSSLGDLYCDIQLWERASVAYQDALRTGGSAYMQSYVRLGQIRLLARQRKHKEAEQALFQLPAQLAGDFVQASQLLAAQIAYGQGQYEQAHATVQAVIGALAGQGPSIDRARAHLLAAQIATCRTPDRPEAVLAELDSANQIAAANGQLPFLVAEVLANPGLLRWAGAANWSHAESWRRLQQNLLQAAQLLQPDDPRPLLVVRTLGQDEITLNGQQLSFGWQKAAEVLYYLLAHPSGVQIMALREELWPNLKSERSAEAQRMAIYKLRSLLPEHAIELHNRKLYQLNRTAMRIDYDVERFLRAVDHQGEDLDALLEAFDLYKGQYLESLDSQWCLGMRAHLEQRYVLTLHTAAVQLEQNHRLMDAMPLYRRILEIDPLDEAAHTRLMACYVGLNNRAAAISQYQTLRRVLDDELGLGLANDSEAEVLYRNLLDDM